MGYNDEHAARIVFDIETAPLPDAGEYIEPAEAPSNYKDAAKIDAYVAEKNAENLSRCGLDVDLCRVVAIGWQSERDEQPLAMHLGHDVSEEMLLKSFWVVAAGRHVVGFNCLTFDLPVLFRRSLYLGLDTPNIVIDRFKHPQVTDLSQVLSYNGVLKLRGLSFYAKRFGVDTLDTLTGADIAKAVTDGRWDDIEAHVKADVQKTARLAEKLGYFRPVATAVL